MKDNINRAKVPDLLAIKLAADADLNKIWAHAGTTHKNPALRITVREALIAASRRREPGDTLPQSQN